MRWNVAEEFVVIVKTGKQRVFGDQVSTGQARGFLRFFIKALGQQEPIPSGAGPWFACKAACKAASSVSGNCFWNPVDSAVIARARSSAV